MKTGLSLFAAQAVVDEIFDSIRAGFLRDESTYIRGFGSLMVRQYKPYTGRNPKTGAILKVPRKRLPVFAVSEEMRKRINKRHEPAARLVHSGPGVPRRSTGITGTWDCIEDNRSLLSDESANPSRSLPRKAEH